eukprot:scaffold281_cov282-Ochromonas_danica.AAC.3
MNDWNDFVEAFGEELLNGSAFHNNMMECKVSIEHNKDLYIRNFNCWWRDQDPICFQPDFTCSPYYITSVSDAFQILTTGYIKAGPGANNRFGTNSNVVYVGFPYFTKYDSSKYGSVSFEIDPHVLLRKNTQYYYRYSTQHRLERSHLFLVCYDDNNTPLPYVPLRKYPLPTENNGIWWAVNDDKGNPSVHFRKKDDNEFVEFAVLFKSNKSDDGISLDRVNHIRFQTKTAFPYDVDKYAPSKEASETLLVMALGLHYFGDIPNSILNKFGVINIRNLEEIRKVLLTSFEDNELVKKGINYNLFADITFQMDNSPFPAICRKFAVIMSKQIRVVDDTIPKMIHYLRRNKVWFLPLLKQEIERVMDDVLAAIDRHNRAL